MWWSNTKGRRYDLIICDKAFKKNSIELNLINTVIRQMAKKLFVYAGAIHKHEAQKPVALEVK